MLDWIRDEPVHIHVAVLTACLVTAILLECWEQAMKRDWEDVVAMWAVLALMVGGVTMTVWAMTKVVY